MAGSKADQTQALGPEGLSPAGQSLYIWRADEGWRLVSCPGGWGWLGLWTQPLPDKLHPHTWLTAQWSIPSSHDLQHLATSAFPDPEPPAPHLQPYTRRPQVSSGFWKQWHRGSPHPASRGGPQAVSSHVHGPLGKGGVRRLPHWTCSFSGHWGCHSHSDCH